MSRVDQEQANAILRLVTYPGSEKPGTDAEQRVLEVFESPDGRQLGEDLVRRAIEAKDGDDVELALIVAFRFGTGQGLRPLIHELVRATWHTRHEDVATLVEELRGPDAVEDLTFLAWAQGPYLMYPGDTSLARTAAHGLERISTPEAIEAIEALSGHPDSDVRDLLVRMRARHSD